MCGLIAQNMLGSGKMDSEEGLEDIIFLQVDFTQECLSMINIKDMAKVFMQVETSTGGSTTKIEDMEMEYQSIQMADTTQVIGKQESNQAQERCALTMEQLNLAHG